MVYRSPNTGISQYSSDARASWAELFIRLTEVAALCYWVVLVGWEIKSQKATK